MGRGLFFLLEFFLLLTLAKNFFKDDYVPKGYVNVEKHLDPQGFQDFTDYVVFTYDSTEPIEKDTRYTKVTAEDIEVIAGYFENFRGWMEVEDRLDEYSFDDDCISEGDYYIIKTREGEPIGESQYGKYDSYTIHFFDSEGMTLYYIHNNI